MDPLGFEQENADEISNNNITIKTEEEAQNFSLDITQQTFTFDGAAKKQSITDRTNIDQEKQTKAGQKKKTR